MSRLYLVSGFLSRSDTPYETRPYAGVARLEDDEVMDFDTLERVKQILIEEYSGLFSVAIFDQLRITHFQLFETSPGRAGPATVSIGPAMVGVGPSTVRPMMEVLLARPGELSSIDNPRRKSQSVLDALQLNECGRVLPPVESRLLIEIAPDVLLYAMRHTYAERKDDKLEFHLEAGGTYIGRPRWTHA